MQDLKGKKLLIIGGAFQHCKLVEAARRLGVETYVTDYLPLEQAPAKQIADGYFMYNITQIEEMAQQCRVTGIDGVIATSLDACQRPYQQLCQRLGLPCFGTEEQYRILTDKQLFKAFCRKSGVDVIPEYSPEDFAEDENPHVQFPVLVKPGISRGSRGQSICHTCSETREAISLASRESNNGQVVIEKYMGQANDFSMTILVVNGKAYPFRTVDRILGKYEDGLDKLAVGATMPSVFTKLYMSHVHDRVAKLISDIGLVNAPVFMQGFVDGDTVRFYDPGLRFPGGEYERMFEAACGKNLFYPLIEYALTGQVSPDAIELSDEDILLQGKLAAQVLPALRAGRICRIEGMDTIRNHPNIVSAFPRYTVGDTITESHNVNQRFAEIDIVCDNAQQLKEVISWVYNNLKITDENGQDMIVSSFSPDLVIT